MPGTRSSLAKTKETKATAKSVKFDTEDDKQTATSTTKAKPKPQKRKLKDEPKPKTCTASASSIKNALGAGGCSVKVDFIPVPSGPAAASQSSSSTLLPVPTFIGATSSFNRPTISVYPPVVAKPGIYYRNTTLGKTLVEALLTLYQQRKITNDLAEKILVHFDVRMRSGLSRTVPRVLFMAESMVCRSENSDVMHFLLNNVEFSIYGFGQRDRAIITGVEKVRIEAHPSQSFSRKKLIKKKDKDAVKKYGTKHGKGKDKDKDKKNKKDDKKKSEEEEGLELELDGTGTQLRKRGKDKKDKDKAQLKLKSKLQPRAPPKKTCAWGKEPDQDSSSCVSDEESDDEDEKAEALLALRVKVAGTVYNNNNNDCD